MNVSSAAALQRLQTAALQKQAHAKTHLDADLQNTYRIQLLMHALYEEQGTVTEFQNILGHMGILKWEDRTDGQNG